MHARHLLPLLLAGCAAATDVQPAPGHAGLPVLFWAHYMPQIGTAQIDANGHAQGATDSHPFIALGDAASEADEHLRLAVEAGLDGLQLLGWPDPALYAAARRLRAATGRTFYLNPQWCDQPDHAKAVEQMARFAVEHRDDPHVFRIDGRQVHFFYDVAWARSDDDERIDQAKAAIRERGVEVLFLPADGSHRVRPTDTLLLDRLDLERRPWPVLAPPQPGPRAYLDSTRWDGADCWSSWNLPDHLMAALVERLRPAGSRYRYLPAVAPGYDSTNRARQAIHVPHRGVGALRDGLRQAVRFGFRQIDAVTWNDVNETMLLPSTRSPWGLSTVTRFWRGMAEDHRSPFDAPRVVVAYDPEALYGDELPFQAVVMPERGALSSDYQVRVRWEDHRGREVAAQSVRIAVPDDRDDAGAELRLDTTPLLGRAEVLTPVVDVLRYDPGTSRRVAVHQALRLAPVTLRCNKLQAYTSYVIALDRVAPDLALDLSTGAGAREADLPLGGIAALRLDHTGPTALRRASLAEGRMARGAFREDDRPGEGIRRGFLRLRAERSLPVEVRLSDGTIHERFAFADHLDRTTEMVGAPAWSGRTMPNAKPGAAPWKGMQNAVGQAVLRASWAPGSRLALRAGAATAPAIDFALDDLACAPALATVTVDGAPLAVRVEWAQDGLEANRDQPRPASGSAMRFQPMGRHDDATRYLHAWALTADQRIAWSRPVVLRRHDPGTPAEAATALPLIRTRGTWEDQVTGISSAARNPFTPAEVVDATVPARLIPSMHLDCDEGAGVQLNDGGASRQLGRAWLDGPVSWIGDGWRGTALRFTGGSLLLRSTAMPHGAYTVSLRLRAPLPAVDALIARDGDLWQGIGTDALRIVLQRDGRIAARRRISESEGQALSDRPIHDGWNHVVVVHDLRRLRLWLDGTPAGEGAVSVPGYQRTHSNPAFGFSPNVPVRPGSAGPALGGDLDQIEIIGTALDDAAVAGLHRTGRWR